MSIKTTQRGFTLIELLVVIAIIGILASVVLASLNSARNKGAAAAVKAGLANSRAQAELYYDDNSNSYLLVCTKLASDTPAGIKTILLGANAQSADTSSTTISNATTATESACNDSATAWAAEMPLKGSTPSYYCVDSTGVSEENSSAQITASTVTNC